MYQNLFVNLHTNDFSLNYFPRPNKPIEVDSNQNIEWE